MKPLKYAPQSASHDFHKTIPVRVYEGDGAQSIRIHRSRELVISILATLDKPAKIVELGCGTADISGPFAEENYVCGFDCAHESLIKAQERFPRLWIREGPVTEAEPIEADILIVCEFLEHLEDPFELVKKWLPHAKYVVISHPLEEPEDSTLSGGEHRWSYDGADFMKWFEIGGHELTHHEKVTCGSYTMILGTGQRK